MAPIPKFNINQALKSSYQTIRADKLMVGAIAATALTLAIGFVALFVFAHQLPSKVPLYYSLPWGEERLVTPLTLIILPGSASVMFVVNLVAMLWFSQKEPLLSKLLSVASVFVAFLSIYTLVRIMLLVL